MANLYAHVRPKSLQEILRHLQSLTLEGSEELDAYQERPAREARQRHADGKRRRAVGVGEGLGERRFGAREQR
jgi:hypothetical protein